MSAPGSTASGLPHPKRRFNNTLRGLDSLPVTITPSF